MLGFFFCFCICVVGKGCVLFINIVCKRIFNSVSTRTCTGNTSDLLLLPWLALRSTLELLACVHKESRFGGQWYYSQQTRGAPKALSVGVVLSARRWPPHLVLRNWESLVPFNFTFPPPDWRLPMLLYLCFPALLVLPSLIWTTPASIRLLNTHGSYTHPVTTNTQAAQPEYLSACPANVIKMPEAQGRESNSHWRGWEASPLRRRRKETWVCFLGSENKPERRERELTPDLGKLLRQNLFNAIKTDTGNFLQISEVSKRAHVIGGRSRELLHGRDLPLLQKLAKWLVSIWWPHWSLLSVVLFPFSFFSWALLPFFFFFFFLVSSFLPKVIKSLLSIWLLAGSCRMEMIAGDPGIMNLSGNSPGPDCLGLPGPYLKVQLLLLTPAPTGGDTSPASGSERQKHHKSTTANECLPLWHTQVRQTALKSEGEAGVRKQSAGQILPQNPHI